jgi:hypothetical protein
MKTDWMLFLEKNYYILTNSLRPYDFFPGLRQKMVFTDSDQDEVMRTTPNTTVNQMCP